MFKVVGKTLDGRLVVSGVYRFYETHGMPLDVVFQILQDKQMLPCWISFHREAMAAGMQHDRLIAKLDPALSDSYGSGFRDYVVRGLERLREAGILK